MFCLLAHNGHTDRTTLQKEFNRLSIRIPSSFHFVDTIPLIRRFWPSTAPIPQGWGLENLSAYFKLQPIQHRGLADCNSLYDILVHVLHLSSFKHLESIVMELLSCGVI